MTNRAPSAARLPGLAPFEFSGPEFFAARGIVSCRACF